MKTCFLEVIFRIKKKDNVKKEERIYIEISKIKIYQCLLSSLYAHTRSLYIVYTLTFFWLNERHEERLQKGTPLRTSIPTQISLGIGRGPIAWR